LLRKTASVNRKPTLNLTLWKEFLMKPLNRTVMSLAVLFLASICSPAQNNADKKSPEQKSARQIWIRLRSGPVLTGDMVKIGPESVDFTEKGISQSVPCDDIIGVLFAPPPTPLSAPKDSPTPLPMTASLRPTILYREKAVRNPKAEGVQGTVVLQVVFNANGTITDVKIIRGLPYGLSDQAIEAAKSIRFIPAMKDGTLVSVRGFLEFPFN
jgi:TonB family protein